MPRKRIPGGIRIQPGHKDVFARNRILEYSPHDCQFMDMAGAAALPGWKQIWGPGGVGECCGRRLSLLTLGFCLISLLT